MKFNRLLVCLLPFGLLISSALVPAVAAATTPSVTWKLKTLNPSQSYLTSSIASSNSTGTKTWSVSGSCSLKSGRISTRTSGSCTIKLALKAKGKFAPKTFSKRFLLAANTPTPPESSPLIQTTTTSTTTASVPPRSIAFTNRTIASGLQSNWTFGVFVVGSTVYVGGSGLAISTDGGTTFTKTSLTRSVKGLYVVGATVYAAVSGGLAISTDGGTTFTFRTAADGLACNNGDRVFVAGSVVYVSDTNCGLSISTDGGVTFTTRTTADGLNSYSVYDVFAVGSTVYVGTKGGLSISTDGGVTFTTRTAASGLGNGWVQGVYVVDSTVYAATSSGLRISTDGGTTFRLTGPGGLGVYVVGSTVCVAGENSGVGISTDGGTTFTQYKIASGLGSDYVRQVFVVGSTVYAATTNGLAISD
jgi:hypothetical protein